MKIVRIDVDDNPYLSLHPETEADQVRCRELHDDYQIVGFGKHAETGEYLHVDIPIERATAKPGIYDG